MGLSVIGAGFGRTGTLSLKLALEQLGCGPCHHMVEVFKTGTAGLWEAAADGRPDWEVIFAGYRSAVDWPTATFYAELAGRYPEAKVILTVRDPEDWYESTQATIFKNLSTRIAENPDEPFSRMAAKVVARLFGGDLTDKANCIAVFQAHNARVREVIPAERLLVYHVSDGWEPLARFLGAPAPAGPTPKANSREEFPHEMASRTRPAGAA